MSRHLHDLAQVAQPAAHVHDPASLQLRDTGGAADLAGLTALGAQCAAVDGHAPFDEHTLLSLDGPRQLRHGQVELRQDGALVGCAVLTEDATSWSVEVAVAPRLRGQGWGRALLVRAARHVASHGGGAVTAWTHGDAPAAAALGRAWSVRTTRTLDVLRRSLDDLPDPDRLTDLPDLPGGLRLLDTDAAADRDAWLALTNAAFADHPDNGGWTRTDLDWRLAAPWTSADRWPVVADGGRLLAGVWTKREPGSDVGELYVVAVAPDAQGRGLGRLVVLEALRLLAAAGCTSAELYVEADNAAAQHLYRSVGFRPGTRHTRVETVLAPAGPVPAPR